jgi:hypothetical protein
VDAKDRRALGYRNINHWYSVPAGVPLIQTLDSNVFNPVLNVLNQQNIRP